MTLGDVLGGISQFIDNDVYIEIIRRDGGDPFNHVFYHAAIVLDRESELLFY